MTPGTGQSLEGHRGRAGSHGEGQGTCANGSGDEEDGVWEMAVTNHQQPRLGLMWGPGTPTTHLLLPNPRPHLGEAEIQVGFLPQLPNDWEALKKRGEYNMLWECGRISWDRLWPNVTRLIPQGGSPAREK